MDYLNTLKMDLKTYKQVKFNDQMKNMNSNVDFIKDNYENFNNNNDNYLNRFRNRGVNNQYENLDNHNYNFNNEENYNYEDNNLEYNYNNNQNNYINKNNVYGERLSGRKNLNLRSSSTMIFNKEEFLNERNNNSSINESKLTKFASIGKNLVADSEFIPINESKISFIIISFDNMIKFFI